MAAAVLSFVPGETMRRLDQLFDTKHSLNESTLELADLCHKTPLGGRFTFYFAILALGVTLLLAAPWLTMANLDLDQVGNAPEPCQACGPCQPWHPCMGA